MTYLTAEQRREIQPTLDRLAKTTPWFQQDIDLVEETRARDAGMSTMLTIDEAIRLALAGKVDDAELPAVLEKHRAIQQALAHS